MSLSRILLVLAIWIPAIAAAQTSIYVDEFASWATEHEIYEAEGLIAFYSLGEESSPAFGASLGREFFANTFFGFRALLPFQDDTQLNMYSLHGYSRYFFVRTQTSAFVELDLGVSGISGTRLRANHFIAGGMSLGIQHKISNEIHLGAMVGTGLASAAVNDTFNLYPKVAMTSTFKF